VDVDSSEDAFLVQPNEELPEWGEDQVFAKQSEMQHECSQVIPQDFCATEIIESACRPWEVVLLESQDQPFPQMFQECQKSQDCSHELFTQGH
jgi:hypothetical protein